MLNQVLEKQNNNKTIYRRWTGVSSMKIDYVEIIYKNNKIVTGGYEALLFNTIEIEDKKLEDIEHALIDKLENFSVPTKKEIRKIIREKLSFMLTNSHYKDKTINKAICEAAKEIAELTQWGPVE